MGYLRIFTFTSIQTHMDGRNNNFNLLRMIGALMIMFAHAMFVTIGDDITFETYPVRYTLGITTLNLFFALSGMLVTTSWIKHQCLITYAVSRIMRIFPGLIFVSFICALIVGPMMSSLPLAEYVSEPRSWTYWPFTALLHPDMTLPGVFVGLPNDQIINAPLWTLRYEVFLYCGVALAGLAGVFTSPRLVYFVIFGFALYFFITLATDLREIQAIDHFSHFAYAFLIGASFYLFRSYIPVSLPLGILCMAVSIGLVYQFGLNAGEFLLIPSAALIGIWVAYVPGGFLRYYNGVGDYSYGLYIWHYPIEQIMRSSLEDIAPIDLFFVSLPIALPIAMLSWHFIERPALMSIKVLVPLLKNKFSARLQ